MVDVESLTYEDREHFHNLLLAEHSDAHKSDDEIILNLSLYLQNNEPINAEDSIFQQNTLDLINALRAASDVDVLKISRTTLKLLSSHIIGDDIDCKLKTRERLYITGIALKQIEDLTDTICTSELHGLREHEKIEAEELLVELATNSPDDDPTLVSYGTQFVDIYEKENRTPLVYRFINNIRFLVNVLDSSNYNNESMAWARGALSYIKLNDDVIPDDLGLIGLLDDMYIARIAIALIDPDMPPWTELVLGLGRVWPILNNLVFAYGKSEYIFTDIASISAALVCLPLRQEDKLKTALVLPFSGLTANMIAIASIFGTISSNIKDINKVSDIHVGDYVRVDNEAIAIFDGTDKIGEVDYIRLNQIKKATKNRPETITTYRIPASERNRLCVENSNKNTGGKIPTHLMYTNNELTALESILHLKNPLQFNKISKQVWLISPINRMRTLVMDLSVNGQRLLDVFPMGHYKRNGEYEAWSNRFGELENILTVVSDFDLAIELLEEKDDVSEVLLVADLSGANRSRYSALSRLIDLDLNYLLITEERDEELISLIEKYKTEIWEWSKEDLSNLSTGSKFLDNNASHPFQKNDSKLVRSVLLNPTTHIVEHKILESCFVKIKEIEKLIKNEQDTSSDFEMICRKQFLFFLQLTRMPFKIWESWLENENITSASIEVNISESLYLTADEKISLKEINKDLKQSLLEIQENNSKWVEIHKHIDLKPDIKVLIPNNITIPIAVNTNNNFLPFSEIYAHSGKNLIVPFWLGKKQAWRMISEANYEEIKFILYPYEYNWYESFIRQRDGSRQSRIITSSRRKIFPKIGTWPKYKKKDIKYESNSTYDFDTLETLNKNNKAHILKSISMENDEATYKSYLVTFKGGNHAFLTLNYEARVVTHLVDFEVENDDNSSVVYSHLDDVVIGDILLFLKNSDRDAIQVLADKNLPSGRRDLAKLWQKALQKYVLNENTSLTQLVSELSIRGCRKHRVTIKNWLENDNIIGPRDTHRGDIEAIAKVTTDSELLENIENCKNAITDVWGHHLKASYELAKSVLAKVEGSEQFDIELDEPVEVIDGVIIARIEYIDTEVLEVPRSKINVILEKI